MLEKIQFRTKKDGVTSLTEQINAFVEKSGVQSGLLCAFITHTTAGLTVNSFWDPLGHEDIQDEIRRLIPTRVDFKHQHDTPEDSLYYCKRKPAAGPFPGHLLPGVRRPPQPGVLPEDSGREVNDFGKGAPKP